MNYLQHLKSLGLLEITKETKKVSIKSILSKSGGTKETKETKEVLTVESSSSAPLDTKETKQTNKATEEAVPQTPLISGWLVAYRGTDGLLHGGCDDRAHGTVLRCEWDGRAWTVLLTDGQRLALRAILSVGKTEAAGTVVAAWTVRDHGYDGAGGPG